MKATLVIVSVIFLCTLPSCSKTCYCTDATIYLNYVAFDQTETDTIILRRYVKNSNYGRLVDTAVLTGQNAGFTFHQDTLSIRSDAEALTLRSFYDFVLYLPALNRSDSLQHIEEARDKVEGSHGLECNCINRVLSYRLNNDTLQVMDPVSPAVYIYR